MKRVLLVIAALLSLTVLLTACKKGRRYPVHHHLHRDQRRSGARRHPRADAAPPMRPTS